VIVVIIFPKHLRAIGMNVIFLEVRPEELLVVPVRSVVVAVVRPARIEVPGDDRDREPDLGEGSGEKARGRTEHILESLAPLGNVEIELAGFCHSEARRPAYCPAADRGEEAIASGLRRGGIQPARIDNDRGHSRRRRWRGRWRRRDHGDAAAAARACRQREAQ
jgi:hypothetical protein